MYKAMGLLLGTFLSCSASWGLVCTPPVADCKIDFATGQTTGCERRRAQDRIRIAIYNLNPTRVNSIELKEMAVEEPDLQRFGSMLAFAANLAGPSSAAQVAAAAQAAVSAPVVPTVPAPTQADAAVRAQLGGNFGLLEGKGRSSRDRDECLASLIALRQAGADAVARVAAANTDLKKYSGRFEVGLDGLAKAAAAALNHVVAPQRTCSSVNADWQADAGAVDSLSAGLGAAVVAAEGLVVSRASVITDYRTTESSLFLDVARKCPSSALGLIQKVEFADAPDLAPSTRKLTAARDAWAADRARIDRDLTGVSAQLYEVGDFEEQTKLRITVRSELAAAKSVVEQGYVVAFSGRRRFSFTAGVGWSGFDRKRFEIINGFERSPSGSAVVGQDGKPVLARIVDLTESSDTRVIPLMMLHTRLTNKLALGRIGMNGLHASFGLTGKIEDDSTDVEYVVGLSGSWAEERFFVTLGVHTGTTPSLLPGYHLGQRLPDSITAPPTMRERHWQPVVSLTYRLR